MRVACGSRARVGRGERARSARLLADPSSLVPERPVAAVPGPTHTA